MSDQHIIFSPERNQWTLADGRHHMEVPEWAREIMRDEFEREMRPLQAENDRLRERITTQKQTIQSYRDESREWREVADHAQADNTKLREECDGWKKLCTDQEVMHVMREETLDNENDRLRELVAELYQCSRQYGCDRCGYKDGCAMFDRMAQLGVEVDG